MSHVEKGSKLKFLGCNIIVTPDGKIVSSMTKYLARVQPVHVSKARKKNPAEPADDSEVHLYRMLAKMLLYIEQAVLSQASVVTSKTQQKLRSFHVLIILDANHLIRALL